MSRRKKKKLTPARAQNVLANSHPLSGGLTERADTAALLYNTLKRVAPEDIDGIQRAYVEVTDNGVQIGMPSDVASFYGLQPTAVAELTDPFPLIPQHDGPAMFDEQKKNHRAMLRQALRRLVDDV